MLIFFTTLKYTMHDEPFHIYKILTLCMICIHYIFMYNSVLKSCSHA
jgi:hypothetical protein